MRGKPEQGNGLLEHESPLYPPVQVLHDLTHRNGGEQTAQRSACSQDVCVRYLVEGHEYRGKDAVQADGDGKCQPNLFHTERPRHDARRIVHSQVSGCGRHTCREHDKSQVDAHTQHTPYYGTGAYAEAFAQVFSCTDAQAQQFTQRRKNGKFQEAHHHAVCGIERLIACIQAVGYKERREQSRDNHDEVEVGAFHDY